MQLRQDTVNPEQLDAPSVDESNAAGLRLFLSQFPQFQAYNQCIAMSAEYIGLEGKENYKITLAADIYLKDLMGLPNELNQFLVGLVSLYFLMTQAHSFVFEYSILPTIITTAIGDFTLNFSIWFSHTALIKKRKHYAGYRLDIMEENIIEKGGYGSIHEILATFKNDQMGNFVKQDGKPLVVKRYSLMGSTPQFIDAIFKESIFGKFIGNGFKQPLFSYAYAYNFQDFNGRDLYYVLTDKKNPLTTEQRLLLAEKMSLALWIFHTANFVHRDIKYQNIMCSNDLQVIKLIDFLGSKYAFENDAGRGGGTETFQSPEILKRENTTAATDRYSLGRVLEGLFFANHQLSLSKQAITVIHKILYTLKQPQPEKRCDLETLLNLIRYIRWDELDKNSNHNQDIKTAQEIVVKLESILIKYVSIGFISLEEKQLQQLQDEIERTVALLPNNKKSIDVFRRESRLIVLPSTCATVDAVIKEIISPIKDYQETLLKLTTMQNTPSSYYVAENILKRRFDYVFSLENFKLLTRKFKKDLLEITMPPNFKIENPFGFFAIPVNHEKLPALDQTIDKRNDDDSFHTMEY